VAKGISSAGDVLVSTLNDGTDLNDVWAEIAQVLDLYNTERSGIVDLLSYHTTQAADAVPQSISSDSFEEATEFGVPRAIRPPSDVLKLGFTYRDYDLALRATWRFLREATQEQVTSQVTRVLESDNKNVTGAILGRLFNPVVEQNEWQHNCYGLWNADMTPPPYLGKTFDSAHTHYLVSNSTVIDSQDIEQMIRHVKEHGYGTRNGSQMLIFAHPDDVQLASLTAWRAGVEYRSGGPLPLYDFIPSALMPAWISDEQIHGPIPAADFHGLEVHGSFAGALLCQSYFVPLGYVAVVASGGPGSESNPVGFREHVNSDYHGLRKIAGPGKYPLQDATFARGFGVGTRHRGAAVVCKIAASGSYSAPVIPR
jgi:hypothetical protein